MIIDPTTSMTRLKQFFSDELPNNTLDIPDLIRIEDLPISSSAPLNSYLMINNSNLKSINLPNLVQFSPVLKGNNLRQVNLQSLKQIEFGSARVVANLAEPTISFLQDTKIESLELPNFLGTSNEVPVAGTEITSDAAKYSSFRNNHWLKTVSMGNNLINLDDVKKFNGFWFQNNYSLVALKLNYPFVIPIDRREGLNTTPIGAGNGYIYVPSNLVDSYKTASIWSYFGENNKIKSLDEYNISAYNDTITDSWPQIISNCNTNNYGKYSIGDTKTLYLNNGIPIQMTIVAKGFDNQENGSKAPLTWMTKTISLFTRYNLGDIFPNTQHNFHNATSNYRAIFTDIIWNQLDPVIQNGIKPVIKRSAGWNENGRNNSIPSVESLWPPSASELGIMSYTDPYPYFSEGELPNYFLGFTNLIRDEQNNLITVGTRDYSNQTGYPDVIRSTSRTTRMELVYGSDSKSYIIFGFCT